MTEETEYASAAPASNGPLRRFYDWVLRMAGHRRALPALAIVSFTEASFQPVPPDVLLVPMVLSERRRAWVFTLVCTLASVAGGLLGYLIGWGFFDLAARPVIEFYGLEADFERVRALYEEWGVWIVFAAAFTPIPYKVFTIASGVMSLGLVPFVLASLVGRGLRYALVAGLVYWFGPPVRDFVERRLGLVTLVATALLIGGFLAVRYLF